ncbi:MAG TPA: tautomerase family protein [Pseudogracilibacillus sp.]|nr:tautomerase family protein [Pseudogracilibacillus sp.]
MPYITVKLMEGRPELMKKELLENITETVSYTLRIEPTNVRVELQELKEGDFAIGGKVTEKISVEQTTKGE